MKAQPHVIKQALRQINHSIRDSISSNERKSVQQSRNNLKEAISDNKKDIKTTRSDNAVKKVVDKGDTREKVKELSQAGKTDRKEIGLEKAKTNKLPKTLKNLFLVLVAVIGLLGILKKYGIFSKILSLVRLITKK